MQSRLPYLTVAALLAAFSAGYLAGSWTSHRGASGRPRVTERDTSRKYRFTSPLLDCDISGFTDQKELRPFRRELEELAVKKSASGEVSQLSVYFRDLNMGPWIGLGEKEKFAPASLLKVPIMLAYLKWAESDPGVLDRRLVCPRVEAKNPQLVAPSRTMTVGREYPAREYIERMITASDNDAAVVLLSQIGFERLNRVYTDLGIEVPVMGQSEDIMRIKDYAAFFRVLYNASYLGRDASESALEMLSRSSFANGLKAGVPQSVPVAHKFGERRLDSGVNQLHDCGIVYYPGNPYLLCVMSRGTNMGKLAQAIEDVSRLTYHQVSTQLR